MPRIISVLLLALLPAQLLLAQSPPDAGTFDRTFSRALEMQEAVALLKPRAAMFEGDLGFAYVLGTALLQTNDERGGQVYIDQIFKAGDSAEAHLLMGVAYLNQFDYASAKSELERALQLNSTLPAANSAHGRALLGLGDQPAAERAFRRELTVNINDFE